ncbi:Hsp33 family molecular chaperone HslO [Terrisporobacter vanillatitrophus]|uniref:Hsp33 family molecular chaperone HslO n=1 Tax=Terrisporobacter vanillatitrophus TaxID=3058402 RepID=UPI003368D8CD
MKDYVIKATSTNGQVRAYVGVTKNLVQTARDNHNTIKVATAALGRTLTATAMMGLMMKNDKDELSVIIKGGGPIGTILTTADAKGNVKGYVQYPDLNGVEVQDYPNGKLNVAGAVGNKGYVKVIKDLGLREPYVGSYPLVSGEIAEDFTHYFALSEQTPSVVSLGVLTTETEVQQAGGLIVQLMPDATEETIATLEQNVSKLKSVTTMLSEGMTLDDILNLVLEGLDPKILDICDVKFDCNCSKDRIKKVLISLGRETLTEIIEEDKQAEISCHFCNSAYHYDEEELREILDEM